jgi:hypothetical protein
MALKVGVVMADYDGTIAPLGVPREESRIFKRVETQLRRISRQVPVCIVTAKDFDFVHPRSYFAAGWACVSGLDVRLADGRQVTQRGLKDLSLALRLAESSELLGSFTELKRDPSGRLLAVAIDWTGVPEIGPSIVRKLRPLAQSGLVVARDRYSTYADVYGALPDKGKAARLLQNLLEVKGAMMFLGDSIFDNSAFQKADISIGVVHGQRVGLMSCEYVIEQAKLARFLQSLSDCEMDFEPCLPGVRTKKRA